MGEPTGRSAKSRVRGWLDSDLVGIPATAYTFFVLAVSLAVFRFGGPVAGIVVAIALWVPMVVFAIREWGEPPAPLSDIEPAPQGARHRVLLVADHALEDPAVCAEVCRRAERMPTEAYVLAPVYRTSALENVSDDVDRELAAANRRVEAAVKTLGERGVRATGRADNAEPMEALLDGLRTFPPNEVVVFPEAEPHWAAAEQLAERVRGEVGLPVTEVRSATA